MPDILIIFWNVFRYIYLIIYCNYANLFLNIGKYEISEMWFTTMLWWYSHKIPMSTLLLSSTLREIWRFHVHQYTLLDITCLRKSIVEIYLDYICLNSRIVFNMPHKGNQRCTMVYILKIVTHKSTKETI